MKQKALLLLATVLLTLACLGAPQPTTLPVNNSTATPESAPSATPQATALPEPLGKLKIAYILDGNVWFWDGGAPALQLTTDGDATRAKISDDGAVIAYQRGQSLWAVNTNSSSSRLLVDVVAYANTNFIPRAPGVTPFLAEFEFSPNSHWVYFSTAWGDKQPNLPSNDLHRLNTDSPTPQVLLTKDRNKITFSPDGNLITLSSQFNIKVINADGTNQVTAMSYSKIEYYLNYQPQIVWLSDGSGFYTVFPEPLDKTRYYFVSKDGSFFAQLAEFEAVPISMDLPIISPDGLKVAYVYETTTSIHLHVIEASTTDTIIASYEGAPFLHVWGWSPDSKRVVFSNAHPMLLLTAGLGIPPAPLTEAISPNSLRWIDAEHFIFFREGNLLIGQINNPETILIASGFSNQADAKEYDFVVGP